MAADTFLDIGGNKYELPTICGTEGERAIDIQNLRSQSGYITLDPGYVNTGSCSSAITYIDGDKGTLRYRGISIEELAEHSHFIETAYLLIWGDLPTEDQRERLAMLLTDNALLHENLKNHFEGFPWSAHPMAMLSAMINALSCYHPALGDPDCPELLELTIARLMSKIRTIAAFSYKMSRGEPFVYPDPKRRYVSNLLHMMFSLPHEAYEAPPVVIRAVDLFLMLHADHEQNCSTSIVRMTASTGASLFASVAAGICALWGRLHGGANQAVIGMLQMIHDGNLSVKQCIGKAKDKDSGFKLMGFGHRVYKSYDPRAQILKKVCDELFKALDQKDPLLDIARELEDAALNDSYFIERKLYPNVDFYSGILLRVVGIPTNMFTVLFAMGRLPGWIAHWKEVTDDKNTRIARPRQIYTGHRQRPYVASELRDK